MFSSILRGFAGLLGDELGLLGRAGLNCNERLGDYIAAPQDHPDDADDGDDRRNCQNDYTNSLHVSGSPHEVERLCAPKVNQIHLMDQRLVMKPLRI